MKQVFNVEGMTCASCVAHVEKAVNSLNGVENVNVSLISNKLSLDYDESLLNEEKIINAVKNVGYSAYIENKNIKVKSNMKNRVIVSLVFMMLLMYISMGHMINLPIPSFLHGHENALAFAFTQFLLTLPIVYVNMSYYTKGFKGLFKGASNMDTLVAIGSLSALMYGIFAIYMIGYGLGHNNMDIVIKYHSDLYFESCGMILAIVTLGKYFEEKSKNKTKSSLEKLINLAPKKAIIEVDGVEKEVLVEDIKAQDIVILKQGQIASVDGEVIYGNCYMDESFITGESIPVFKEKGSKIIQSTINTSGFIKVRALKVGKDTIFSEIVRLVEEAGASKAPISKLADKVSGVFVSIILVISLLTFIYWIFKSNSFSFSLSMAISVLLISCPCALGLATPLSIMVSTGIAAENGMLVKNGEVLEILHKIDTVVLDKTGTITKGKPSVIDVVSLIDKQDLLDIVNSLEKQSEHPISKAVIDYCINSKTLDVYDFEVVVGKGIKGKIDNINYFIGNKKLMIENNINISNIEEYIEKFSKEAKTLLIISNEKEAIGLISILDTIKETSKKAIADLKAMGIKTIMLTGDNNFTANAINKDINVDEVISDVLPQEKQEVISKLQSENKKVLMIGDGANDSIALIKADVGIAMGSGIDIALDSGDAVVMSNDLLDVVSLIRLSKKTIINIKENLFWAFFYNVIGIPIACGLFYSSYNFKLNPMLAAFFMSISSLFVVSNALRLKSFKKEKVEIKKEESNMVFIVNEMSCQNCVKHIKDALDKIGVQSTINLENKKVTVLSNDVDKNVITKTINDAGYKVDRVE